MHAHFPAKIMCTHLGLAYTSKFLIALRRSAWKTVVNIKKIKEMSELNFPYFCEISYFLSIFVIMMISANA